MDKEKTLFESLGGEEGIQQVVAHFYQRVLDDDRVNFFFANTDMEKQKVHQTKFISFALGGPNKYTGKSMAKAHEGMNLQPEHLEAIIEHLRDSLIEFSVQEEDIQKVIDKVKALEDDVLYK